MTTASGPDTVEGVFRWYDPVKGYGFVTHDINADKGADAFIHCRYLPKRFQDTRWPPGHPVRYKQRSNPRTQKLEAYDVEMER